MEKCSSIDYGGDRTIDVVRPSLKLEPHNHHAQLYDSALLSTCCSFIDDVTKKIILAFCSKHFVSIKTQYLFLFIYNNFSIEIGINIGELIMINVRH